MRPTHAKYLVDNYFTTARPCALARHEPGYEPGKTAFLKPPRAAKRTKAQASADETKDEPSKKKAHKEKSHKEKHPDPPVGVVQKKETKDDDAKVSFTSLGSC
jgi:hypothetical protein